MDNFLTSLQETMVIIVPIILGITLHEAAHGYVAYLRGDKTALSLGRVTFNPFKHVDPLGTILIPGLLFVSHAPFIFGYAKPVPIDARRLITPRWDMALVAVAGPLTNICLAIVSAGLVKVASLLSPSASSAGWLVTLLIESVRINVILALFNMLPLLPLDGGRIVQSLLPPPLAIAYGRHEPYGMFILIGLLVLVPFMTSTNVVSFILSLLVRAFLRGIFGMFGLS